MHFHTHKSHDPLHIFCPNQISSVFSPMEQKPKFPAKSRVLLARASAPPSPIPTGKGSRCAADPILSAKIDSFVQIPELTLPQYVHEFKPEEINYQSLFVREIESVRALLRSVREFGAIQIVDHGISTEELRFALANCELIFGITTVECCTGFGESHARIVWNDRTMEAAAAAVGGRSFRPFRQKMGDVGRRMESIAAELGRVIAENDGNEFAKPIPLGHPSLSIYRYHRPNIIDQISSVNIEETGQESSPFALCLHLLLESSEFCLETRHGNLSFDAKPGTIVVTIGEELQEWSRRDLRSSQGRLIFKPSVHTNKPSFSIEQKWSSSNLSDAVVGGEPHKIISLHDQTLMLLLVLLLYKFIPYILS